MADVLAERRRERDELIGLARSYVERLAGELDVVAAAVAGSVARGDFNVWSDVDVVVVAPGLPERAPDGLRLLGADAPAGSSRSASPRPSFRRRVGEGTR